MSWEPDTIYTKDTIVRFAGVQYVVIFEGEKGVPPNILPDRNHEYWMPVLKKDRVTRLKTVKLVHADFTVVFKNVLSIEVLEE